MLRHCADLLICVGKGESCEGPEGQAGEPVAGAEEADPD
jgi:hypothetical protein